MTRLAALAAALVAGPVLAQPPAPAVPPAPVPPPVPGVSTPAVAAAAAWTPSGLRVYILDGVNPVGLAGTGQLGEHLRRAGFPRVTVGGWYSAGTFEREIREAHAADPTARFAVIGYSFGTYPARNLANRLVRSGVPVAVVGYVGGDYLADTPDTRVPGAGRVVNVTGDGYLLTGRNLLFNGTTVGGATNVRLPGTWHYGLPTHPATFRTLYAALLAAGE